jgi:hypothetical protein
MPWVATTRRFIAEMTHANIDGEPRWYCATEEAHVVGSHYATFENPV